MKNILMIIANNGFQDYEFGIPFDFFHHKGVKITIGAGRKSECVGVFGSKTIADKELEKIYGGDYDMVIFIGGGGAYSQYFHDKDYLRIAKEAKKLGAICIAPMILSESGIFNGKNVTGWDQNGVQKKFIQDNGGFWVDKDVVISGNIVTANGPDAAQEFAEKCLEIMKN
ncbi:MAG TPA: DJ-1/PfpI family protein [Candidatus Absconditabacterales bacterium]|nr:DJ-1/PfpI family protein [Candidatus Absconditabacterales bacterium]